MTPDTAARLATLREHPGLAAALAERPSAERRGGAGLARLGGLVVWVLGCLAAATGCAFVLPPLALVPLALGVLGALALVQAARADARHDRAPREALAAVVVSERTRVAGAQAARASHVVELLTEDGPRDVPVEEHLIGRLQPGATGVVHLIGGRAHAFRALPGPPPDGPGTRG